jgi:hypothetical protein
VKLKKGDVDNSDDDDEVRSQCVTKQSDSNTVYCGILPQGSVYVGLLSYQPGEHVREGRSRWST